MKSRIRPLNLMKIVMFSVLNLLFGHTCSMFFPFFFIGFCEQSHKIEIQCHEYFCRIFITVLYFIFVSRGGRFSDGWGSCERREKRFLKPNHDIPSTAETRAKNKACQVVHFSLQAHRNVLFVIYDLFLSLSHSSWFPNHFPR